MTHLTVNHPLDYGKHYHLKLDYNTGTKTLSAEILGPINSTETVEHHLAEMLTVEVGEQRLRLKPGVASTMQVSAPVFDADIRLASDSKKIGENYGRVHFGHARVSDSVLHKLVVFETRMLGNEVRSKRLPYPRQAISPSPLITDLHTHSSGQISAKGLIDIATQNHIPYPTRLLDRLHIDYPKELVVNTKRFFFPPTDMGQVFSDSESGMLLNNLSEEGRVKLAAALSIPPDQQITFGKLETTVYCYRTPITKHPAAAYDLLLKTAQEYKEHGIRYAEITATSTSLLTPDYIKFLHENLPKIEKETGVKLRFLAGIPRNFTDNMMRDEIEKVKIMAASPYIVGLDFMGFEDTKINKLKDYIETIADWAIKHGNDPEFTLRIHAGENRKNMNNVKESLHLAEAYGMRVRIGHAAHGLDSEAIDIAERLAKRGLVMIEFNPDSNMALNNIDRAKDLNIITCIDRHIPFVMGSDGSGLYQTDSTQLWHAANFAASVAGIRSDISEAITQSENTHMQLEEKRFNKKMTALPPSFLNDINDKYKALKKSLPSDVPDEISASSMTHFKEKLVGQGITLLDNEENLAGKKPLMILGASGDSYWNIINDKQKEQIKAGFQKLVKNLDPTQVYFVVGRPKNTGITKVLSEVVTQYNNEHKEQQFSLLSATVQADQTSDSFTPGLTHVLPLKGSLFDVPDQLVDRVEKQQGHIIFIGGGTFTRDAILIARNQSVTFGLMVGPEGASTDKSKMMYSARSFKGAEGMIQHLYVAHPELFKVKHKNLYLLNESAPSI